MSIKNTARYNELKEALDILQELKVPQGLEEVALKHLLTSSGRSLPVVLPSVPFGGSSNGAGTKDLREYIAAVKPKGAVAEIPALLFWAKSNEDKDVVDEKGMIELYRRAGLRPPKNVAQSFRDLSSRKYGRLEAVEGQAGYVRLSRVGEDYVLHDLAHAA